MKKHVITSKTIKMATPLENNPEFTHFTNYMGVQLTTTNLQIYSDLYHNFVEWPSPDPSYSFAEKFISWKRFYDEYKETQEQIINTNLFATPPTDPRTLKTVNVALPQDLQQLNTDTFQHFILENNPQPLQTPTDSCPDCSKDSSSPHNPESIMDVDTLHEIASQHVEIIEEVLQQSDPTQATLSIMKTKPITFEKPSIAKIDPIVATFNCGFANIDNPAIIQDIFKPPPQSSSSIHNLQHTTTIVNPQPSQPTIYNPGKKIPTQGKNITQMKAIYGEKKITKTKGSTTRRNPNYSHGYCWTRETHKERRLTS
jgi:hypothetical protein